jgi:large subunit ribosomal protein L35
MPKLKTNRSAKKRFFLTGLYNIYRHRTRHRHKLAKRTQKKKRQLKSIALLTKPNQHQIKKLLPYL